MAKCLCTNLLKPNCFLGKISFYQNKGKKNLFPVLKTLFPKKFPEMSQRALQSNLKKTISFPQPTIMAPLLTQAFLTAIYFHFLAILILSHKQIKIFCSYPAQM